MTTIWILITLNLPPTGFEIIVARTAYDDPRECQKSLAALAPTITGKCQEVQLPPGFVMARQR